MTTDNSAGTPAPASEGGSVETVRKVYAKDLREKDRVQTVFRVTQKSKVTARSGKVFLSLVLGDKSGEVDARIFDKVDTFEPAFAIGDHILVQGHIISFHGKTQLVVEALERLDPGPLDLTEFEPPPAPPEPAAAAEAPQDAAPEKPAPAADKREESTPDKRPAREEGANTGGNAGGNAGARAVGQIREIVTERINDPYVKQLLLAFLDDPQLAAHLPIAPAGKGVHHAYRGGLAEHLLSVMRLTLRVADHYPMADRDLLLAGALLHDVMKVAEISAEKGFDYTDEGKLVGHLVMSAQKIREKTLAIPGFPPLLEHHLTHLVLAHNGKLEYGSPKLPMTLEAYIVHALDTLDSRIASWLEAMARDSNEKWTEPLKLYDQRQLWKAPAPTSRGKSPVEGRRKTREERRKPKGQGQGGAAAQGQTPATEAPAHPPRKERPPREGRPPREERGPREERPPREGRPPREERGPREERPPRAPRDPNSLPQELTFKPFSALTTLAPAPAESSQSKTEDNSSTEG
ncbi:HD domain-containing protein [Stigmatella sp. ncwal1]|uniref:HD domain-containing protein n=1 Tax=Stigmatella ashevillensis TaxID=2995309 RepID=A0ABT5D4J2_9BACT|nr:HD domain-containing protein [Stigmatella ashevillena]MDC0708589.1 HD domain-containing protein [Stigmatella ashevillena]